jgi:hypothetical protein
MSWVPFSADGPRDEETQPGRDGARPGDARPGDARPGLPLGGDPAPAGSRGVGAAHEAGNPGDDADGCASGCPPEYEGVPLSEIIEEAEALDAEAPPEAWTPGFLPRDVPARRVTPGAPGGFASGGALDTAKPCPVLAAFADEATGPDGHCAGASDDELIGILRAWQRQEAWAAARRLAVTAELIRRRPAPGSPPVQDAAGAMPSGWDEFCADELAAATACSRQAAEKTLVLAYDLAARLPGTARALHEGIIDAYKARIISDATRTLDDAEAAAAEARVLPGAAGKTPGQLRAAIGRAVIAVNPDAARARRELAERDARVELWREDAGTAALCGRDLPPAEALAADQRITAYARDLKAAGVEGSMDQLRARAFLDLALGVTTRPSRPAAPEPSPPQSAAAEPSADEPGPPKNSPAEPSADRSSTAGPGLPRSGPAAPSATEAHHLPEPGPIEPGAAGPGPSEHGRTPTPGIPAGLAARINLTVPLATLLGLADRPGEAAGLGAIDPALARTLAGAAAQDRRTAWCVTVTDQDGHPTAHGCARPARTTGRGSRRSGNSPPTGPPPGDRRPGQGGTGDVPPGGRPPDQDTGAAFRGRLPPAGGTGCREGFAFTLAHGQGPPGRQDGGYGRWRLWLPGPGMVLDVTPAPLAVTDCDHRDQCEGYQPSDRLRHLVQIRDGECTWPPCRRAARRCDFEHAIPYDQGGVTCACNAGARCRHHHHAKQAAGWQLAQHLPGYHTWTTPSGRQYMTGPAQYPI